jgi:hypothetical protein
MVLWDMEWKEVSSEQNSIRYLLVDDAKKRVISFTFPMEVRDEDAIHSGYLLGCYRFIR